MALRMAKRRWAVMLLFHGVGGADDSGSETRGPSPSRDVNALIAAPACWAAAPTLVMPAALATSRTIRSWVRIALAGLRIRLAIVRRSSSRSLGISSGSHAGLSPGGGASGVRSFISVIIRTPDAPSIVAWWYFVSSAQRVVLQALDDVHLPQRAGAIHRAPDDAGDLIGELVGPTGRRQAHVADVEVEVEGRVVDPVRVVEVQRHLDDPAAHRLELADLRREAAVHRLVRIEVGARSLVDGEAVDVTERRRRLHVQEAAVQTCELLHPNPLRARCDVPRRSVAETEGAMGRELRCARIGARRP